MSRDRRTTVGDEDSDPARVVRMTPPGRGAVAVVLVDGRRATELVAACLSTHSGRQLDEIPLERVVLARWGGTNGEELVVCRRTPQQVEVHPHGGEAAVENVVQRLVALGAVECPWERWVGRGESCQLQAAAQIELSGALTRRTAAVLLDQFQGALRRDLQQAIALLDRDASAASPILDRLLRQVPVGLHLVKPWHVVLAGQPNVGKSSLINALVGYERAIVYEQPGTTRDIVTVRTAIDGWPIELSDTAGLRKSSDPLEAAGIQLAEQLLIQADLVIRVLDASLPSEILRKQIAAARCAEHRTIVAANKVDLLHGSGREVVDGFADDFTQLTSAWTGEGIDGLLRAIAATLIPDPPRPGEAVPFRKEHADQIKEAVASLDRGDVLAARSTLTSLICPNPPAWETG